MSQPTDRDRPAKPRAEPRQADAPPGHGGSSSRGNGVAGIHLDGLPVAGVLSEVFLAMGGGATS